MKQYRINGETRPVKAWASIWGCSYSAAINRLYTLAGRKIAVPVRL